jgi:hypothetical protein
MDVNAFLPFLPGVGGGLFPAYCIIIEWKLFGVYSNLELVLENLRMELKDIVRDEFIGLQSRGFESCEVRKECFFC